MRLETGQHLRMDQRLKLSPRMIQSMEILQLPTMALEERIEQELSENPTLEMVEPSLDAEQRRAEQRAEADGDYDPSSPMQVEDSAKGAKDDFNRLADVSDQYDDTWSDNTTESGSYRHFNRSEGERDGKMDAMANTEGRSACLSEVLHDQWRFIDLEPEIHEAGALIIDLLDDDGYLRLDREQVLAQAPAHITGEHLEQALKQVQTQLEPAGIAARDLRQCLLLQLAALPEDQQADPDVRIAKLLVRHHLKDLEMNRLPKIAKARQLTVEQINDGLAKLRRLDPKPGRSLVPDRPEVIVPDVIVEYDPINDVYVAALARGRTPSLQISTDYRRLAKDRDQDTQTRQFLATNLSNARWLIDSIQQRNSTLLRVVNVVIEAQREFLDHGEQYLKPLPMIGVAERLGIHVGTVSRAVSEKYMQTPRGIYPLRMFFSGGTESADGDAMSWAAVQAKLREIIDNEDPESPWSDEQLVEQLKEQGIDIARRTIAKYRNQMNIPPARRRRQYV